MSWAKRYIELAVRTTVITMSAPQYNPSTIVHTLFYI